MGLSNKLSIVLHRFLHCTFGFYEVSDWLLHTCYREVLVHFEYDFYACVVQVQFEPLVDFGMSNPEANIEEVPNSVHEESLQPVVDQQELRDTTVDALPSEAEVRNFHQFVTKYFHNVAVCPISAESVIATTVISAA